MNTYTRKDVEKAIAKYFPKSDRAATLAFLGMYGEEASEPEQRRVQLAIVKLSKGDKERLVTFLDLAKKDYHAVLQLSEDHS